MQYSHQSAELGPCWAVPRKHRRGRDVTRQAWHHVPQDQAAEGRARPGLRVPGQVKVEEGDADEKSLSLLIVETCLLFTVPRSAWPWSSHAWGVNPKSGTPTPRTGRQSWGSTHVVVVVSAGYILFCTTFENKVIYTGFDCVHSIDQSWWNAAGTTAALAGDSRRRLVAREATYLTL